MIVVMMMITEWAAGSDVGYIPISLVAVSVVAEGRVSHTGQCPFTSAVIRQRRRAATPLTSRHPVNFLPPLPARIIHEPCLCSANMSLICFLTSEDIKRYGRKEVLSSLCEPAWPGGKAFGW